MLNLQNPIYTEYFSINKIKEVFSEKIVSSPAVGADGTKMRKFQDQLDLEIETIIRKTKNRTYKFTRYKQKLISKGAKKYPRIISIPTIRDRLTLRIICEILRKSFRNSHSILPNQVIKKIKKEYKKDSMSFVRIDIEDFYPSINHKLLMECLRPQIWQEEILELIEKAIKNQAETDFANKGIPQGLSISNILASIYLEDFDAEMSRQWNYFRYVDDMLIVCPNEEAQEAFETVKNKLVFLKLNCHELNKEKGKSYICNVSDGTEYLGYNISLSGIRVRKSSFNKMFNNILKVFSQHKYNSNETRFIWKLNLKISGCIFRNKNFGWMFFFSEIDDLEQLHILDAFIKKQLSNRGMEHLIGKVKTFVKTYREIRSRRAVSTYFPNFDEFDETDMKNELTQLKGIDFVKSIPLGELENSFYRAIKHEVSQLERDLSEVFHYQ